MKSVTEFSSFVLANGLKNKATLTAENKPVEEIQAALGTALKYEGDKLKHFWNALEVAAKNTEGLGRILVVSLVEGEKVPAKAEKVEEHYYVPEFNSAPKAKAVNKNDLKAAGKGKDKRGGREKESPWGLSPEQKAAKKGASAKAAAAAKAE